LDGSTRAGVHTATRGDGIAKSGGITPTTRCATPSTVTVRPTAAGSPPSRSRHSSCETTATGAAPRRVSSAVITRPWRARTPSVANRLSVTAEATTRAGSSPARTLTSLGQP
jgi:hypothetical protein